MKLWLFKMSASSIMELSKFLLPKVTRAMAFAPLPLIVSRYFRSTLEMCIRDRRRVVELRLPPLRERKGDIPALTEYFIKYFNSTRGRYIAGISNELKKEIMEYDWPGNVRELRNVIERGFNMAVTPIIESRDVDLFDRIEPARREDLRRDGDKTLKELVDEKEKEIIEKVYSSSRNITEAAGILKISRQGLSKKLIEYGIDIK